jgi:tetratricopeptide (TPR) repeat protein
MKKNILSALKNAFVSHKSGNFLTAERGYLTVLKHDPANLHALMYLGQLYLQTSRYRYAADTMKKAIVFEQSNADLYSNLGFALHKLGDHAEALNAFHCALDISPLDPDILINQGNVFFDTNDFVGAKRSYTDALRSAPNSGFGHYNLGRVHFKLGEYELALERFIKAKSISSEYPEFDSNLIAVYLKLGRFEDAKDNCEKLISLGLESPELLTQRSVALAGLGLKSEAISSAYEALQINDKNPAAWNQLGILLLESDKHRLAGEAFDNALKNECPKTAISWALKASALTKLKDFTGALGALTESLRLEQDDADIWISQGSALKNLKRYQEAIDCFDKALSINPESPCGLSSKGDVLSIIGEFSQALECCERAVSIAQEDSNSWVTLGSVLVDIEDYSRAMRAFDKAIELDPKNKNGHIDRALLYFRMGRFSSGWADYEWRWEVQSREELLRGVSYPEWCGLGRGAVLVLSEQGIGDQILYASRLGALSARADSLEVTLDKRLCPLFRRSFPDIVFHQVGQPSTLSAKADKSYIPIADIWKYVDYDGHPQAPYLFADKNRSIEYRKRLVGRSGFLVGLAWASSSANPSLKGFSLIDLRHVFKIQGVTFVSLQYENQAASSTEDPYWPAELVQFKNVDNYNDIDGLASLILACDCVVTCSNSTAHLAGALGVKTYLLLPFGRGRFWYWDNRDGVRSKWYPSVQIYQKAKHDVGWGTVMQLLKRDLQQMVTPNAL